MKRCILFLIVTIISLMTLSCSNNGDTTIGKDITTINEDGFFLSFKNINDLYFVGEETPIEIICSDPNIDLSTAVFTSLDERIIRIENKKLLAIKSGVGIITCNLNGHTIQKIVYVNSTDLEDERQDNCSTEEEEERIEAIRKRREALLKEANEHGFDSIFEYREYLTHDKRMMDYQAQFEEASRLGLSYEDYVCLKNYGITYDVIQKKVEQAGFIFKLTSEGSLFPTIVDEEKYFVFFKLKCRFISSNLGTNSEYGNLYCNYMLYNNYGEEIDIEKWNQIVKIMPLLEKEVEKYEYLKEKVGVDLAHKYILVTYGYYIDEYQPKLTDEEKTLIIKSLKEYEEK